MNNNLEIKNLDDGYDLVVGSEEVGRGPWAGPLYIGAYVYNSEHPLNIDVNDSKRISKKKREKIYKNPKPAKQRAAIIVIFYPAYG